jgi:hypothetical protein
MPSFALVTEGITDQIALEAILIGHYDDDDLEVNPLQPLRDATDVARQGNDGGWELVLEYCTNRTILDEAFVFNDYLIIQIDTDCGEHKNFDVPLTIGGKDKSAEVLIEEIKAKINSKLGKEIVERHGEKIFYAVCVHSLECWLLPLYAKTSADISATKKCEARLERVLKAKDKTYVKDAPCYKVLVDEYAKSKVLKKHRSKNQSLNLFLDSLPVFETQRN